MGELTPATKYKSVMYWLVAGVVVVTPGGSVEAGGKTGHVALAESTNMSAKVIRGRGQGQRVTVNLRAQIVSASAKSTANATVATNMDANDAASRL